MTTYTWECENCRKNNIEMGKRPPEIRKKCQYCGSINIISGGNTVNPKKRRIYEQKPDYMQTRGIRV